MNVLLKFRYIFVVAVFFLLTNSIVFIVLGVVGCVEGYIEFTKAGFSLSNGESISSHLLEGLDHFVSALVFMIFGLGLGQLFLLNNVLPEKFPAGLRVKTLKGLKVLLWETILVALVIFCITHVLTSNIRSWEILPLPVMILVLSLALFFVKWDRFTKKSED